MLVDDHLMFREGLRGLLSTDPSISVVAEASSARESYALLESEKPDVALVDVGLKGTNGVAATREMIRRQTGCKVLILTAHTDESFVLQALDAGAKGYATKEQPVEALLDAIHTVARGETYLAPTLPRSLLDLHRTRKEGGKQGNGGGLIELLSPREREIFDLILRGFSNESMAQELCISVKTVETHRAHINRKLRVHSTADLMRFAVLHGLFFE
jgi:DNA-binding NarL/FixJ family response regulator